MRKVLDQEELEANLGAASVTPLHTALEQSRCLVSAWVSHPHEGRSGSSPVLGKTLLIGPMRKEVLASPSPLTTKTLLCEEFLYPPFSGRQ